MGRGQTFIVRLYAVIKISLTATNLRWLNLKPERGWQSQASTGLAVGSIAEAPLARVDLRSKEDLMTLQ